MGKFRKIAAIVVVVLAVSGIVAAPVLFAPRLHLHYENRKDIGLMRFEVLIAADDVNISIVFTNDSSLLYSVDVTKYANTTNYGFNDGIGSEFGDISIHADRLKQIEVVFGTAVPCGFHIAGKNVTAYVTYDHGAIIDGQDSLFNHGEPENYGAMYFTLTENVIVKSGMWVVIGPCDDVTEARGYAYLDIDLPTEMSGRLTHERPVHFIDNSGWIYQDATEYRTAGWGEEPGLYLEVAYETVARLLN